MENSLRYNDSGFVDVAGKTLAKRMIFCFVAVAAFGSCSRAPSQLIPAGPSGTGPAPHTGATSDFYLRERELPASSGFTSLYSFMGTPDGWAPEAALIDVNGNLYGTTAGGGSPACACGTVYKISPLGSEQVVYAFTGGADGASSAAPLINVNGTLYGTTYKGGSYTCSGSNGGCGTVFKITPSGQESVIHSFDGSDGRAPFAGLTYFNGLLYGTTGSGGSVSCSSGADGCGVVFAMTLDGKETVLHQFGGGDDGAFPQASLIIWKRALYGTTGGGGASQFGTIFRVALSGKEKVLHSFTGMDGVQPLGGLTKANGMFYGTTSLGGTYLNGGTVFKVTPAGAVTIIYNFQGGSDGSYPRGNLVKFNGAYYGTTSRGGETQCPRNYSCGTVFKVTQSGIKTILHVFTGMDGDAPQAGLTLLNGLFYGTTGDGGAQDKGTVFSLAP